MRKFGKEKLKTLEKYTAYFDGACGPSNPGGKMGLGAYILDSAGNNIFEFADGVDAHDSNSNNVAEYMALCEILKFINENIEIGWFMIYGDSKLVIKQMNREWRILGGLYHIMMRLEERVNWRLGSRKR